ncbi:MAG: tetratricopeptide repeat protein, partial [Gallionella sp.]|nr:tetratricopeptide repeat protein [Gallionella sp.]
MNITRGGRLSTISILLLALALFCQISTVLAAATLMGVVRENQIGGSPVKNVSITALGANPVMTGNDGRFALRFPQLQPGENVSIDVLRSGWVVVNDIQLKRPLPANAVQSPLEILICKIAEREQWALQFYRLMGHQVAEASYERKLFELGNRNTAGAEERERLLRERDQARAQADELARQIASHPVGGADENYQKAMSLFLDKRMDEALDMLSEERLRHQAEDVKKQQEQTLQGWLLRGHLLALNFDFDAAARAYGDAVKFAPDSYEAWFAYSFFHYGQIHFKESRDGYGKALILARARGKDEDVADTLNNLGILRRVEKRMNEARQAYEEALKIRRELADKNPNVYLPDVAATLNNLGLLNLVEKRMTEARQTIEEALKIRRELADKNPNVYLPDVAATLNNLGLLNRDENRMNKARQAFEESLKIRRELADKNPNVYLPDVALTLNNLGILHRVEKRMTEARQAFEEALKIRRELA